MTLIKQSNGFLISDIINNHYIKKLYIGYSKKQAVNNFKQFCKTIK